MSRQEIPGAFEILRDPQGTFTIDDVASRHASKFRVATRGSVDYGFSGDTFWVHVLINNLDDDTAIRILELPSTLDQIVLFERDGHDGFRRLITGKKVRFSARAITTGALAFRLVIPPREKHDLWLRLGSRDSVSIHPVLWTEGAFKESTTERDLWSAAYSGAIATIALFNFLIWLSLRDRAYLYYSLFQSALLLTLSAFAHNTFRFLWPESPEWASRSEMFFCGPLLFAMFQFVRSFVGSSYLHATMERAMKILMTMALLLSVCALVSDHRFVQLASFLLIILSCSTMQIAGTYAAIKGSPNGPVFVVAWSLLLVGGVMSAASALGVLDEDPFLLVGPQVGSVLEAILLSFGLAQRIKIANIQRSTAQQKLIDSEHANSRVLEKRVADRTLELERALDEVKTAQNRMVRQARLAALGHMVGGVAHEIGNPLNFVVGGVAELRRRLGAFSESDAVLQLSPRQLDGVFRAVALVDNGTERIKTIVDNLREHVKQRVGPLVSVDPVSTLENTLALIEPMTISRKIQVERQFAPVPMVAFAPGELGQVVLNILLNSCQAMPEGGTISVATRQGTSGAVEIVLSDSGVGIPREHRDAIFDPFFTTRAPSEGVGLGLSLSQRIIEERGGDITLLDTLSGTTFVISLPGIDR